MTERLFVYGSLAPAGPNQQVLSEIGGRWLRGSVRGRLCHVGWGAGLGYPAMILDESADPVPGHIFVSDNLREHWDRLDAFEGAEYERVTASVLMPDGTMVDACVYVLRDPGNRRVTPA